MTEYRARSITEILPLLMAEVLETGNEAPSRNGPVRELLHPHVVLTEPWRREVLSMHRKVSLPAQIAETMWVLAGRDDVAWLQNYLKRAPDYSDDGEVWRGAYGKRLRDWQCRTEYGSPYPIDQLDHVINLLGTDPLTRRAVMQIYDPAIDTEPGKDIPCNNWLHFQQRDGKLHLHVAIRSNDLMWGWSGINAFEWSALQEIVAGILEMEVGELHFSISNLHLYKAHWERAERIANAPQIVPPVEPSPRFSLRNLGGGDALREFDALVGWWFEVEEDIRLGRVVENQVDNFPEPLLRSWLVVLNWWWNDAPMWDLKNTPLGQAALLSPGRPERRTAEVEPEPEPEVDAFTEFIVNLHEEKNKVYGTSWRKRGEKVSILANIARKIDRLGVGGAGDTAADTVIDLLVYLVKYRHWLDEPNDDSVEPISAALRGLPDGTALGMNIPVALEVLKKDFDWLEIADGTRSKHEILNRMVPMATSVARRLWEDEQKQEQPVRSPMEFFTRIARTGWDI
jgi:thymidylate synthase